MRKIVLLLTGLVLIVGGAAWIDVAVAEKGGSAKARGDNGGFEAWKYPGSKELGSGQGAGGFHAMLTTPDGMDKVESFYETKTGQKLKPDQAGGHGIGGGRLRICFESRRGNHHLAATFLALDPLPRGRVPR